MSLNLVMLGPPGAGKGTQAERFAREHGIPKVSTGDILREAVQADTPLGRAARAVMDSGRLVGDDLMVGIVRDRLLRADAAQGFVLDGFPRTVAQAEALDTMLDARDTVAVVSIEVPEAALVERLSARRNEGSSSITTTSGGGAGTPPPDGWVVSRPCERMCPPLQEPRCR